MANNPFSILITVKITDTNKTKNDGNTEMSILNKSIKIPESIQLSNIHLITNKYFL